LVKVPLPLLSLTTTLTAPAACAGAVAVIEVLLTTVTLLAAVPPKLTVAPATKFAPVTVTAVPPLLDPELGEIELTVGAKPPVPLELGFKATICMTQGPLAPSVAVAL
jgi:hypothetical protein